MGFKNMVEYDPLETLARVYLERKGYLVRANVPVDEKELDVLAMKGDEVILGECRANLGNAKGDEELIKREHFEEIKSVVEKTYPISNKRVRYVLFYREPTSVKKYIEEAKRNGIDTISTFEMIKGLVESWKESIDLKRQRWGRRAIEPIDWFAKELAFLEAQGKFRWSQGVEV
jgi:Holliday junction resolvase-like predicted endonuclease